MSYFTPIINQSVNFKKKVIFRGIPKTGTTSVRDQLIQKGRPLVSNPHLNIVQVRDLIYLYLLKTNLGTNAEFPNPNHPSDSDLRNQAKDLFNSFFKFSAVRNPYARAVSMYFRSEGLKTKKTMSFDEFCGIIFGRVINVNIQPAIIINMIGCLQRMVMYSSIISIRSRNLTAPSERLIS